MKINDNGVDRDMTADELATHQAWVTTKVKETEDQAKVVADRLAVKQAVLTKLGLTADEVTALLS
jgi:hypothetical protein